MADDIQFDAADFNAGLARLVEEIHEQTPRGLADGQAALKRAFEARAKVLTGDYKRSWKALPIQRTSDGYEAQGGPDVRYSRKLERRYSTVETALKDAERQVGNALEDAWERPI